MRKYAQDTKVPVTKSRTEIERTLQRYGADQFIYGEQEGLAVVGFRMADRQVKIFLPLPVGDSEGDKRERRRLWRSLAMIIKAKLEAVHAGISVFDDEFMAHIVFPDGRTVGDHIRPQIAQAYETDQMPPLLPAPGSG